MANAVFEGQSATGQCQVLLFGDLSLIQFEDRLRCLLHVKTNPLLISFFDRVGYSLRTLVEHLPAEQQKLFPHFTTLVDLLSKLRETDGTAVLVFFLLSVHEVAQAIVYFSEYSRPFPPSANTYVIGPCTGGFAAAAVSCSQTLLALVENGVIAVIVAFRTALHSLLVGQSLSSRLQSTEPNNSWSAAVNTQGDTNLKQVLDDYLSGKTPSRKSALWISAVTPSKTTTLSGRPSVLQDFVTSNATRLKTRYYLDIGSPYHAAHLFNADDAECIVGHVFDENGNMIVGQMPRIPLLSSSTGKIVTESDFAGLLQVVVQEALCEPIRWELVLASCRTLLEQAKTQTCTILPFSSNAASMVSTTLAEGTSIQITVEDVTTSYTSSKSSPSPPSGRFEDSKVAIIGYSGRFPSAASNEAFWELLRGGRDVHREIPEDRFDWKTHFDPTGKTKNTSRIKYGCFIDKPGLFDTRFFNMSPREAENTDPAQRLAIMTTYEAIEMAGMVRNRTLSTQQDRVGVFFGTTSDDWREVNSGQDVGTYFIPGGNRAFVPGRISYFFRFSGPSLSIDTACSSSFAAIQAACSYLWRGECDTAIAGGTNVLTNPDNFAGLDRGHFLSTTGNCNTFDDEASGYCRSDAVGTVILKRLEDAEADNDPIHGVIVGTNTNHCGQTDSITRPHEGDQSSVFKRILRHSNVDPLDVSYVEMHGTGTQAGDATEMNSVLSVFVPEYKRTSVHPDCPLYLGSAKANIGHAESASGVASLIKVLMMMKHNEIPRHCGIKTRINHNYPLDLAQRGVHIAQQTTSWQRYNASGKRAAFLNNFSAAGGNTAILLEDAPTRQSNAQKDPRLTHVVAVTANSPKSLVANINSLISFLEEKGDSVSLPALSYTTTARRMHHNYRVIVSGSDIPSILSALKSHAAESQAALTDMKPTPTGAKKRSRVVFMFSGQGTLYADLGKSLFITNATFRQEIFRLNRLAQVQCFPSFLGLVESSTTAADAPAVGAVVTQLALVCVQIALFELWKSWGVTPAAVIGHSLGEYAMLYAAEVLSAADVIYLVGTRAALLEAHCTAGTHTMLAVKGSQETVEQLIRPGSEGIGCELACANQPSVNIVSGPEEKISEVARTGAQLGIGTVRMDVPYAFHSAQVEPILAGFEQAAAQGVTYHTPTVPVISPFLSKVVGAGDSSTFDASYLSAACRGKVDFTGALTAAAAAADDGGLDLGATGRTIWLEVGVHPVCSGMVKGTLGSQSKTAATLRQHEDAYITLTAALVVLYHSGVEVNWNEYHHDFPAAHEVIEIPMYAWDLKNYWIQYRNDFCLTKGERMIQQDVIGASAAPAIAPQYISPCAQRIVESSHGTDQSSLVVESDIFDERLLPILKGHLVNGAALCPSSMYADVALTLANYMLLQGPNKTPAATTGLEVNGVKVDNPLIARHNETTHRFRVSAKADWHSQLISMTIFSVDANGKRTTSHAKLNVRVMPQQRWLDEWKRNTHLITARINALDQSIQDPFSKNESHLIKRGMAYKLFGALVEYGREYQGMSEVVLDSKRLEAVATVEFQVGQEDFHLNPRWIDSLGHIAGFIMNANDGVDSRAQVFINHGWERMRIAEPLRTGKVYRAYNRMQLVEKTSYVGDTYVLSDGRIVAIFEGVTFQGVPRRMLDHLLPSKPNTATRDVPITASERAPKVASDVPVFKTQPANTRPGENVSSGVFSRILALIGQEVGMDSSEFKAETDFGEVGIDSLLTLTITSKIRDEIGLDFSPSVFEDHPTVKDLQVLIGKAQDDSLVTTASSSTSSSDDEGRETQLTSGATSVSSATPQRDASSSPGHTRVCLVVRQIISEETGVSIDEMKPSMTLADIGVDSLLGLTIGGKLQEILHVDNAGSILVDSETLQDVEQASCNALGLGKSHPKKVGELSDSYSVALDPLADSLLSEDTVDQSIAVSSLPQATSILLSGSPQTARLTLFLFPDGSGSASSYAAMASSINAIGIAIYGLNCPWRKTGAEMTRLEISFSTMVARYVAEVRRLLQQQIHTKSGGIAVGGWSAGGILALEAARQLQQQPGAIEVKQLILFDSPNPIGLQNPPQRMYDFFDSLGIFGTGKSKPPKWLREHFDAFLRILDDYEPTPLSSSPETLIVYARDGICKDSDGPRMETRPDDPREMLWLLNNRTDFTADGWVSILGPAKVSVKVLDEVNHFTLMDPGPIMMNLGRIVTDFLSRELR